MAIHSERKRPRKTSTVGGVVEWLITREAAAQLLRGDRRWSDDAGLRLWLAGVQLPLIRRVIRNPRLAPMTREPRKSWALRALVRAQRREQREDGYNAARVWYERPGALGPS